MSKTSKMLKFSKLFLDLNNKRYNKIAGPFKNEDEVIDYMLKFENLDNLIDSIKKNGYENDEALWIIKNGTKYIVKEGNRRLCALKVLANPSKYKHRLKNLKKYTISDIFCSIYTDEQALDARIIARHTQNPIKGWNRLAQAFQIQAEFKKYKDWNKVRGGSSKKTLYRMANFYEEAHRIYPNISKTFACEDEGKSKFEIWNRLFGFDLPKTYFGFTFHNEEVKVLDAELFAKFIKHTTMLLLGENSIVSSDIEEEKINTLMEKSFAEFYSKKSLPFPEESPAANRYSSTGKEIESNPSARKKNKTIKPTVGRKNISPKLQQLITECYGLRDAAYPNAKLAMIRITLEAALKYVVDNTKYNARKKMNCSPYFHDVYFDNKGKKRAFINFSRLYELFPKLILNSGKKQALTKFDIDKTHAIIHNYDVSASINEAKTYCDNLTPLLSFLLQEEEELLKELDIKKLS